MIAPRNLFSKVVARNRELLRPDVAVLEITADTDRLGDHLGRIVTRAAAGRATPAGQVTLPLDIADLARQLPAGLFDTVVAHGLLEYVPPARRKDAIQLLLGKASRKLVLVCTCDATAGVCDGAVATVLQSASVPVSPQLAYRAAHGCPSVREIYRTLQMANRPFEFVGNQSIMQRQAGVLMDAFYRPTRQLSAAHDEKSLFSPPIGEGEWDHYHDFIFEVDCTDHAPCPPVGPAPIDDRRPRAPGTRIYAVYHQANAIADLGTVTPIYVGLAANSAPSGALTDIVHGAPGLDNSRWCELTAIYKIWKEGPVSEAVGFCHYRRLFDFHDPDSRVREIGIPRADVRQRLAHLAPTDDLIADCGDNWVMTVFPRPDRVSIWDGYCGAHNVNDYCRVINIIGRRHRYLAPFITQQFGTNAMYSNNLFVAPWPLFAELCELWFDVLGEFERATPAGRSHAYQNREIGFLSERILDLWLRYRRRNGTTVLEYPLYLVGDDPAVSGHD